MHVILFIHKFKFFFLFSSHLKSKTIFLPSVFWIPATSHACTKPSTPVKIHEENIPLIQLLSQCIILPHILHLHLYIYIYIQYVGNRYKFHMLTQYGKTRNSKEFGRLHHFNYVLNYISSHCCFVTVRYVYIFS